MYDPIRWTSRLIDAFYAEGVRHAVISPGSRSTPITLAAAVHSGIKKKIVLDERSAGFIALGIGKATGKPALLICTSGTAVANYMPAVIEAKESGTPMVILSADRPPNLRGIGSSQTVDQIKIFGNQAVFFHEAGEPASSREDLNRLEHLAMQAVYESIHKGGSAHINLPFRKPLEPTPEQLRAIIAESEYGTNNNPRNSAVTGKVLHFSDEIQELISTSARPLIIAGPANPYQALARQIHEVSTHLSCPVIAEPGSRITSDYLIERFDAILKNPENRSGMKPDLILQFGDQPFTKSILSAFENWSEVPIIQFIGRDAWQDHFKRIRHRIILNPGDEVDLSGIQFTSSGKWFEKWKDKNEISGKNLKINLDNETQLTDGHIFSHISKSIDKSWNLMLSNSFPARDMAQFGKATVHQFVNRGAAGIDGILSTATGIAESAGKPVCCILGDLAFLHDSNSLLSIKEAENPVLALVINNGGGNIFRMLPVYKTLRNQKGSDFFKTYFETPQNVNIQFLAKASGLPYLRIETIEDLNSLELKSINKSMVIECVSDADASMKLRESL